MKNNCKSSGIWIALLACLMMLAVSDVSAQKVTATVKIIRDRLQGRNLDYFEGMEQRLQNYVNNYDWSKTDDDTPLNIDIQIELSKISESGENRRVIASIYFSNGRELQFFDKECVFTMQKGVSFQHDESKVDSFLGLIDFYIYIMLGDEFDSLGKLAGTPMFQKAKNVATLAKVTIPENVSGWENRLIKADEFLDMRYQDYRLMKDFFYEARSNFENGQVETARKNSKKAIELLEATITRNLTSYHSERFIQAHYLDLCHIFENSGDTRIFDRLIAMDGKNKETYVRFRDSHR